MNYLFCVKRQKKKKKKEKKKRKDYLEAVDIPVVLIPTTNEYHWH